MESKFEARIRHDIQNLTIFRAIGLISVIALTLAFVAAALELLVDPAFRNSRDAAWWAITTVTTVGYGDVVPESSAGRLVASLLMLAGVSAIPITTSLVVAVFVSRSQAEERERDRADRDMLIERLERIERAVLKQDPIA